MPELKDLSQLTLKQEKDVQHFLIHGNKAAAYRHAYSCENMKTTTIQRKALVLFDKGMIRAWLEHYRSQREKVFDISLDTVLKTLSTVMNSGLKAGDLSPVVAAIDKVCKIKGLYAPVNASIDVNLPITVETVEYVKDPKIASERYNDFINGRASNTTH